MDRRLFDVVWEVYRDVDGKQPIRSSPPIARPPPTRCCAAARQGSPSQPACRDFTRWTFIACPLRQSLRRPALRRGGGVGFYPPPARRSYIDVGGIRHYCAHDPRSALESSRRALAVCTSFGCRPLKRAMNWRLPTSSANNGGGHRRAVEVAHLPGVLFGRKSADDGRGSRQRRCPPPDCSHRSGGRSGQRQALRRPPPRRCWSGYRSARQPPALRTTASPPPDGARPAGPSRSRRSGRCRTTNAAPQSVVDIINARASGTSRRQSSHGHRTQIAALRARGAATIGDP